MAEEKILTGDDVIGREAPEYKEVLGVMTEIGRVADKVIGEVKPSLLNERYFSGKEVMAHFHISRRALQNYRDTGVIPYTSIGGVMLYPEAKIREVLEGNYYKPTVSNL